MPFSQFSRTIFQYVSRLRMRNVLPHLIMMRNAAEHAMPMNAAEMKQFWYPMLSTQGVILEQTRASKYPEKRPTQDFSKLTRNR